MITICVKDKHELLWRQSVGARIARPLLSDTGKVVEKAIENISNIYPSITIVKYVIMPNHVHLMIQILDEHEHGRAMQTAQENSLCTVIGYGIIMGGR